MSSEPQERELMPGVFITDFRTAAPAPAAASEVSPADRARQQRESKTKEQAEQDDAAMSDSFASSAASAAAASASSSSSSAAAARASARFDDPDELPEAQSYPRELPSDVEELQLQLAALEKNLIQLIKTNEILLEELKETPDDVDFLEAIAENKRIILQRSDRIKLIRAELQLLAPHRTEEAAPDAAAATAEADRQQQAARAATSSSLSSSGAAAEPEEGLFL